MAKPLENIVCMLKTFLLKNKAGKLYGGNVLKIPESALNLSNISPWSRDLRHWRAWPTAPARARSTPRNRPERAATPLPPWSRAPTGPRSRASWPCLRRRQSTPLRGRERRLRRLTSCRSAWYRSLLNRIAGWNYIHTTLLTILQLSADVSWSNVTQIRSKLHKSQSRAASRSETTRESWDSTAIERRNGLANSILGFSSLTNRLRWIIQP